MNQKIKISQLPAKGSNLAAQDLIEIAEFTGTGYVSKSITGQEIIDAAVGNVDWGDIGGTLSAQTDLQTALNAKQNTLSLTTTGSSGASTLVGATLNVPNYTLSGLGGVPTSRTLTINGVTQDLSADRTFTISTGITIGSTAIASGTVGRILFEGTGNVVQQSSSLFWDATNNRLGIGTSSPSQPLHVVGRVQLDESLYLGSGGATNNQIAINATGSNAGIYSPSYSSGPTSVIQFKDWNGTESMRLTSTRNLLIGTTTDAGFRLDVNGTARVQGNTTVSLNQNATTSLTISNTTSATSSRADLILNSDTGAGTANIGKFSTLTTAYKIIASRDAFFYNNPSAGDISILNDFATGRIKFAAGGASTAQMSIFSTGNVGINTTTDAGFRLDVNGTARVQGDLTLTSTFAVKMNNNNRWVGASQLYAGVQIYAAATGTDVIQMTAGGQVHISSAGGITTQASSIVQIDSTTKGFLPPRMTTTQKNAIASPAAGLMVYDTTLNVISYYNGTMWI